MPIKDMKTISVLNPNQNIVVVSTKHDSYTIEPASDSNNPTTLPLTLDEILYVNGNSAAFKTGILRFEKEIEQEMYEEYLKIPNWKNLLNISDIENIILHPTVDGLTQLVAIKDTGIFDRVRGVFVRLKNSTDDDISLRVENIINARSEELRRGIRNSQIIIKTKDAISTIPSEEVDALKEQNKSLQEQMLNMQKMMEHMMAMQNASKETTKAEAKDPSESTDEVQKKKPGRRPKATTTE